ncbi:2-isopropylmalate synthase [Gehongia tenuis]|uniref:2-isopropylmalate synthase n=1 Tax=Gehongia tenuis TaxID=2763655 RepID=A0A926D614_9FIRM|nr:2-isopropylmalate synthase [Gehongia tenuis]MBC8532033.1 2-isopropylmalate synthase [Gehongia tenuis]
MNHQRYRPYPAVDLPDRTWPSQRIKEAPIWCSVDLRDGNQALETPMDLEQKLDFFQFLVSLGFKQIEIGFPAASETEFAFTRALIEGNLIPDDVIIQVLTQSRPHIITRTFEALEGARKAIVHLYNSTSALQREVVFGKDKGAITALAADGAKLVRELAEKYGEERFIYEYSPESFTGTELDYAVEICNAVMDVYQPTADRKAIINLPSTVEMSTPNIYADQIEYMNRNLSRRDGLIISVHTHNDQGTGVAATELALLAGAERVEGTLFGNGERTGNCDIMNVAMNLFAQGVDPKLDFSRMPDVVNMYERYLGMRVPPRHPYAGKLVFTAFSGSHQDAIRKGMMKVKDKDYWEVPYLPIDPADVGYGYEPIIRINSQSGKGGLAYILEQQFGLHLPKALQQQFSEVVKRVSDRDHHEMQPGELYELFEKEYVDLHVPLRLISYQEASLGTDHAQVMAKMEFHGREVPVTGEGNGLMSAFCNALEGLTGKKVEIKDYQEHALAQGSRSRAITYVELAGSQGEIYFGAGTSSNITKSSIRGVVSAVNKMLEDR